MDAFRLSAPRDVGLYDDLGDRIEAGVRAGLLRDLHGVVVARGDAIAVEAYWPGVDEAWGRRLGEVAHGPEELHDLRSVAKSVVSLLYGVALERGLVPPPDAPLYQAFPDYADLAVEKSRSEILVRHALTMTLGLEWDETGPYTSLENSEVAMEHAEDRIRFVLSRPIVSPPGEQWRYSGGATALIARLIEDGAGKPLDEFAAETLFGPLGIERFEWVKGADGVCAAASGLRMTARGLLKIGLLVLRGGVWGARQIVPESWLEASFAPAACVEPGIDYGYFWRLATDLPPPPGWDRAPPWVGGFGNGGQRLFVCKELDLIGVVFAGAYNRMDAWVSPTRVWREIVLAGAAPVTDQSR